MSAGPQFTDGPQILEGELLPDVVTVTCDEPGCGETFTGPAGGKGSAPMLLGRHRWSVHKIRSDGSRGPAPKSKQAGDVEPVGVLSVVAEAGQAVKGSGPPRADQLGKALGKILANVTETGAGWAVKSDPAIKAALDPTAEGQTAEALTFAQQQATAIAASLSLTEATAQRITAPLGRILAPSKLNQRFGRVVVDNTDLGPAVVELMEVGQAWARFLAVRRDHVRELRAIRQQQAQIIANQQAAAAGYPDGVPLPPAPAPAPEFDGSPLGSGTVATPTYRTA